MCELQLFDSDSRQVLEVEAALWIHLLIGDDPVTGVALIFGMAKLRDAFLLGGRAIAGPRPHAFKSGAFRFLARSQLLHGQKKVHASWLQVLLLQPTEEHIATRRNLLARCGPR